MPDPTVPDDPDRSPPQGDDPFENAPDPWAEADRAYAARWSDDPDAGQPVGTAEPSPPPVQGRVADGDGPRLRGQAAGMQAVAPYLGLGVQIAASMALFTGLGYAVDQFLETSPWGILVGAMLGMVGIFGLILRIAREADAEKEARKKTGQR